MKTSTKYILLASLICLASFADAQIMADASESFHTFPDKKKKGKKEKDEQVKIISGKDTNLIPKSANIQRYPRPEQAVAKTPAKSSVDSSRFVRKVYKVVDKRNPPVSYRNISVSPAVYGKHSNEIIRYVRNYHSSHGKKIYRIKRAHRSHFAFIDNVFKRKRIPVDLKALAVIESAMIFDATSKVGARGPWQFMPATARNCGLRVDDKVDERIDFFKSTHAAARYLSRVNKMFNGDWLLTVAGYNWGPGNITRSLRKVKGNSFWDIKHLLPRETRNHVMAFIATASYMDPKSNVLSLGKAPYKITAPGANFNSFSRNYTKEIKYGEPNKAEDGKVVIKFVEGAPKIAPGEEDDIATLKIKGSYHLKVIAMQLDEDLSRLNRWNPDFNEKVKKSTDAIYLRIPIDKLETFILKKDKINAESRKLLK